VRRSEKKKTAPTGTVLLLLKKLLNGERGYWELIGREIQLLCGQFCTIYKDGVLFKIQQHSPLQKSVNRFGYSIVQRSTPEMKSVSLFFTRSIKFLKLPFICPEQLY
jgi:hypothetical protein